MIRQVGIEAVLDKLNHTVDVESSVVRDYGLKVLTAEGPSMLYSIRKYTKGLKQQTTGQEKRGKDYYNLQRNGIIMVEDIAAGHPKSITAAMIFAFRDHESNEWQKVFH